MSAFDYTSKFKRFNKSHFLLLDTKEQRYIEKLAYQFIFTYQEFHKLCTLTQELQQWNAGSLELLINQRFENKKNLFLQIEREFENLKNTKNYNNFEGCSQSAPEKITTTFINNPSAKILGSCPVASEKTLCCNLQTLDAVRNCGLDCTYCSIQSFYSGNEVLMDNEFGKKLLSLPIEKNQSYHIGTGQSSDSLMWGNKEGILDDILTFSHINPNVILEFKTKSSNVEYLIKNEYPRNIITTWSLNPQVVIDNEEHLTASLEHRLRAARRIADKKRLVGFHFHPIIRYEGYLDDYCHLAKKVMNSFSESEVALISMGTVTFTKKTIKEIRSRNIKSKILQMPFEEVAGKFSYPEKLKVEMFSNLYKAFEPWHGKVFFYLCMEPANLWDEVFGYRYADNAEFENKMKEGYFNKINSTPSF